DVREMTTVFKDAVGKTTLDISAVSTRQREDGFVSLFNGTNFDGWKKVATQPVQSLKWTVEGGELVGRNRLGVWLFCDSKLYEDLHLRAEVKLAGTGDAGLVVRAQRPAPSLPPPGYGVSLSTRGGVSSIGGLFKGAVKVRDAAKSEVALDQWF